MQIFPIVTILIPVYNGSNYMREAIDSALAQTYKNIEVIVVNDGSNDGGKTREIALSYGNKIRYFEKENGGVSTALNLAIKEMKGEFFSWLSHDDVYYPDKILEQLKFYLSLDNPKTIIFSDEDIIDAEGKIIQKRSLKLINERNDNFHLLLYSHIGGCSLLIPKRAFEESGPFNESLKTTQDYDMWFRMLKNGYKFEYLPVCSNKSRIHPLQVSAIKVRLAIKEQNNLFAWALDNFAPEFLSWKETDIFYNYVEIFNNLYQRPWLIKTAYKAMTKAYSKKSNAFVPIVQLLYYSDLILRYFLSHFYKSKTNL